MNTANIPNKTRRCKTCGRTARIQSETGKYRCSGCSRTGDCICRPLKRR